MDSLLKNVHTRLSDTDKAAIEQRAVKCWELFSDSEKSVVKCGMSPHWAFLEDLDGKAPGKCFEDIMNDGEKGKLLTLAFFELAKRSGGMIV
jgi:hypothetical protein